MADVSWPRLRRLAPALLIAAALAGVIGSPAAPASAQPQAQTRLQSIPEEAIVLTKTIAKATADAYGIYDCIQSIVGPVLHLVEILGGIPHGLGTAGEYVVAVALGSENKPWPKNTKKFNVPGTKPIRRRIPDFMTSHVVGEVKTTRTLAYTRQLRDDVALARQTNRNVVVYTRTNTRLSEPLRRAALMSPKKTPFGRISIVRCL